MASASIQQISPCLWFDGEAEEAANFYVSVFPKGKITSIDIAKLKATYRGK
jgi:predicted 3-demethylubiquinone-9 3-methyltransferase (glyoxalase superfamily)